MTDPAKPSPESGTQALPAEIVAAIVAHESVCLAILRSSMADVAKAHAALVATIMKYGERRYQDGMQDEAEARL